jgi:hypothetical protein
MKYQQRQEKLKRNQKEILLLKSKIIEKFTGGIQRQIRRVTRKNEKNTKREEGDRK